MWWCPCVWNRETSLAVVASFFNDFLLLTEKVWLYSSIFPKLFILILKQIGISSLKNRKHIQKRQNPRCTHNSPFPITLPDKKIFIFFTHILGCASSLTRSYHSATGNHHLLTGEGLSSVQTLLTIHRQSLKNSSPDCCVSLQKGPVFYFIWLNVHCFLSFPKMFETSKQVRRGTDLSAVESCEQLQNPNQYLKWTMIWKFAWLKTCSH